MPIGPDRWRLLSPYLDEALEIPSADRAAWLATIRARDAALAADLQAMLAEQDVVHASHFLERAVLDPQMLALQSLSGQVLGAYRLVSPIGHGGMGSVWLAERCDGRFEGRAAVKLLNAALIGRTGEVRFRREGTILARLRHPGIAHLIDAGVSPAGQPYLVLEYVDGLNIDRYCDERSLGIEPRVRLFLDVLEAVAHAHASLVVHRDIKPANVLVSTDGQVKLLDFGIAKLIEQENDPNTGMRSVGVRALTREGGAALTPEYAAPEQLAGGTVTTATDVYALGVLLYVLLSGRHPAGAATHSPATLIRAIVDTEPARVSDAVAAGETPAALTKHAAQCGTTVPRLRRALRGDLDTIVAKALKKNASERYPSVTALADDLRRFLRHEPISAQADTLRYRTSRFVRRNVAGVTASAAAVLLIGALTGIYTVRLSGERDRAQREATKALKASELLMGLLTSADPYTIRTTPGEPTVRAVFDAGAEQVQKELAGQPELQAEMLTMMGRTYRRLGVADKAQQLLEQALAAGVNGFGETHLSVARTLDYLGGVLADKGDYAGAARRLEQALAMRRSLLGHEHGDVAVTLAELGRVYQDEGTTGRAEPLHREALAIRLKVLGDEHRETAVSQSDLASVLRLNGDLASAEILLRQSLEINRKTRGPEHPNTLSALHDLALIAASRGNHAGAEAQFRHILELQRAGLGERHPIVATTLNNLARVSMALGRPDAAAAAAQEALDIARPALGSHHQLVAIFTLNAAAAQLRLRQPAIAEALVREGLRVRALAPNVVPTRRRTFLDDDWSLGAAKSLLGAVLTARRQYDEAEAVLLEARQDLHSLPRRRDAEINATVARLVDLYGAWGKPEKAAAYRALLAS
jgi:serine/threonine protein kinase